MTALGLSLCTAFGTYLLYTSLVLGWRGLSGPGLASRRSGAAAAQRLGLSGTDLPQLAGSGLVVGLACGAFVFGVFGGPLPALAAALFSATAPITAARARRERRLALARESWPRMIEEMRLKTGSLGRSIPQALFEVGRNGPAEMRSAFANAEREWLLSTDFARTVSALKAELADATADATLETLLVAHRVGGSDVDLRLAALVEDRIQDIQGRKDARAKQAGVRFARRFVLVVPIGMALAGLSIGTGREAYQTAIGQLAVASGIAVVVLCWLWAGRLMRLPEEERVFSS